LDPWTITGGTFSDAVKNVTYLLRENGFEGAKCTRGLSPWQGATEDSLTIELVAFESDRARVASFATSVCGSFGADTVIFYGTLLAGEALAIRADGRQSPALAPEGYGWDGHKYLSGYSELGQ
jgi:hypothetical protein